MCMAYIHVLKKMRTWLEIENICCKVGLEYCFVGGDCNAILRLEDKRGGVM